jgi:hypothetical protein
MKPRILGLIVLFTTVSAPSAMAQTRAKFDSFSTNPADSGALGYVETVLGVWHVKYPGNDGMIVSDYHEMLDFRPDGTYRWSPAPKWVKTSGRWGVVRTDEGYLRLCFEGITGARRCNFLVIFTLPGVSTSLNWQRSRGDAVVFADRIFRADRPKSTETRPRHPR